MEQTSMPLEILDHARGATTFGIGDSVQSAPGIVSYQCKVFRTRLAQASASRQTKKPAFVAFTPKEQRARS